MYMSEVVEDGEHSLQSRHVRGIITCNAPEIALAYNAMFSISRGMW